MQRSKAMQQKIWLQENQENFYQAFLLQKGEKHKKPLNSQAINLK